VNHVDADDAVSRSDRPRQLRSVQDNRRAHIRDLCVLHPSGDAQQSCRFRIGRLESEAREISRKMNDVLTRAACDFEDDTRHRQDISKDIENEIAIAYCRGRVLAVIDHLPRTFNFALASLTPRAFVAEVSLDSVRGVYGTASLSHHCRNHATSRDVTTTPALIARGFTLQ
jgi:hypothetical protein